jgi:glycolate oxidase FAD binding subunit
LSGAPEAVDHAVRKLGGDVLPPDDSFAFWDSLRDQTHPFFNWTGDLYRLSLPPTAPHIKTDHDTLIEWAGGQRWLRVPGSVKPADMQDYARSLNGHATLYFTPDAAKRSQAFTEPNAVLTQIQRKLKREFDPAGIFNTGRMSPIF